ncbi:MAG: helix-turn-helix domain-containing protein [Oscillospiraceae bacterium]|nr:helix-turn-helix domain-containing protein [Oscillospiraceae bacterium]
MNNCKPTQNQRILGYIAEFGGITQLEALRDLGVMRLASRISDLKKQGYEVTSTTETIKNRYGEKCRIKRYSIKDKVN